MADSQIKNDDPAEREYKAFISYRHKDLDKSVAQKLHRRIERYIIPKDLRKEDGAKKLGLVFRDQEELPISSNLTDSIYYALDHSEYLIVVCSPDTPESKWVQSEISYFLEHHDRNHLLAILVDGDPEQSFPKQLTEVTDEEGNLIREIEPLAANIVAETDRDRNRLFRTESIRILAALIGCPFDALYHREQRYQMHRMAIAALAVTVIATGFIGMLLNRNARIHEQLIQSMMNESAALSAWSESAFNEGDYRGALNYSLNALPGRDPERPYSADAEKALSSELYLYSGTLSMRYSQSFDQDTEISTVALSRDGSRVAAGDKFGNVRVTDMRSGQILWNEKAADEPQELYYVEDLLFAKCKYSCYSIYSAKGELIREAENENVLYVSEDKGIYLNYLNGEKGLPARVTDVKSGEVLYELGTFDTKYAQMLTGTISPDGYYAALIAMDPKKETCDLFLFDLRSGKRVTLKTDLMYASALTSFNLAFNNDDDLFLSFCAREDSLLRSYKDEWKDWKGNYVMLFDKSSEWSPSFTAYLDFGSAAEYRTDEESEQINAMDYIKHFSKDLVIEQYQYMDLMSCIDSGIVMACRNRLVKVDSNSGKISWQTDLPDRVKAAMHYPNSEIKILILGNGTITFCTTNNGSLSYNINLPSFDCYYDLYGGDISGSNLIDTQLVMIPSRARSRASVISFCSNADHKKPSWVNEIMGNSAYYTFFITSPSENRIAAFYYNRDYFNAPGILVDDLSEGGNNNSFVITDVSPFNLERCLSRAVLTDSGKLILGGHIYDFESGSQTGLSQSGDLPENSETWTSASCIDSKSSKVITASIEYDKSAQKKTLHLWEDGVITEKASAIPYDPASDGDDSDNCICRDVSAAGHVVICVQDKSEEEWKYMCYDTQKDNWTDMEYMSNNKTQVIGMAESHPLMAYQKDEEHISLIDLTSGKEKTALENTLSGGSLTKLIFARDDEWLLAFNSTGAIAIYSTEDGKELHHSNYGKKNLSFSSQAHYEVHYIPETDRILILYDNYDTDINYSEPVAITIDAGSMKQTGFYPEISCYFPSSNTVLINYKIEEPRLCKLYSVEEMQEIAENLLK